MAEDWAVNVKKYDANADDGIIAGIVRYCGIALQKRDSSLVSFGDPVETGRVRDNFLKKKLGLTHSDADLDAAIADVGVQMKGESFRNRVTVYYLLAKRFNLLHLFQKAGSAKANVAPAAAAPAVAVVEDVKASVAPLAAAGAATIAAAVSATSSAASAVADTASSAVSGTVGAVGAAAAGAAALAGSLGDGAASAATGAARALTGDFGNDDGEEKSGMGWLPWLLLALAGLLLLWWLFFRHPAEAPAPVPVVAETTDAPAVTETVAPAEGTVAIPAGAGVTSETRDGKPVVKVYFDTAKTEIVDAFTPAAAGLKSYLDTHAGSSLAVTGFADKRGNAAANAELSKNRAQAVKAALVTSGIADASIELVKPSDAVDNTNDLAGARRVEVLVR